MPFDGATFTLSPQDVLEGALSASGRAAVDPHILYRHKAEQVQRHPAGWAYRHQQAVALAQVAVLLASIAVFVSLLSAHQVPWGFVGGLAMFALGSSLLFVPVKGPAHWRERPIEDLRRRVPGVDFIVGELYQERIKLDPYLVAEYRRGRVVLGIWDGERVIACA